MLNAKIEINWIWDSCQIFKMIQPYSESSSRYKIKPLNHVKVHTDIIHYSFEKEKSVKVNPLGLWTCFRHMKSLLILPLESVLL